MSRPSPRARHHVTKRVALLAGVALFSAGAALRSEAQKSPALQSSVLPVPGSPAPRVAGDSVVRRELRKSIERFQDAWRKAWQKVEIKRHGFIDLNQIRGWMVQANGEVGEPTWDGDRLADKRTPELQRYLSILCYVDTPSDDDIERVKREYSTKNDPDSVSEEQTRRGIRSMTPRGTTGDGRVSFVTPRSIFGPTNNGSVCPGWTPDGEPVQLDEGESIDLALPPAERDPVRRLRELLIAQLTQAQARYPDDEWIAGQRVRFAVDQRDAGLALDAARGCSAFSRWCTSLLGVAQQQARMVAAADSTFRRADSLARAEAAEGDCTDREVLLLFEPGDRKTLERLACAERHTMLDRMWWLADPLWSIAGNERYVEHQLRRVQATQRAALFRDERYVWEPTGGGFAFRELVVRFGWPAYTYWPGGPLEEEMNKLRESGPSYGRPARIPFAPYTAKEYSTDRVALLPALEGILDPYRLDSSHFDLYMPQGKAPDTWWPQEHMMLHTRLAPLAAGQQAVWRRDSAVSYALAIDDPLRNLDTASTRPSEGRLLGGTGPGDTRPLAAGLVASGLTLRFNATFRSQPLVLSAEILPRTLRETARRRRFGLQAPPELSAMPASETALSDPVFLRMPNRTLEPPRDVPTVLSLMAGDLRFARTEPLALYWESYGFPVNDTLQLQMRIARDDEPGLVRRVGSMLGLASDLKDSLTVSWTEPDGQRGTVIPTTSRSAVGRAITVDLQSLPAGNYVVSFEVRHRSNLFARGARRFELTER